MNVLSTNKLVDLTLLGVFKTEIEKVIAAGDKSITDKLGTLPSKVGETDITTWLGYIDAKIAEVNSDASTLEGKVNTLIGDDASKSARAIAAEEVAKVVASAPAAFDTLKEIADWIGSGEDIQGTTAATMLADITKLKGADTVEGSVAYAVKQLADGAVKTNTEAIDAINNETTGILKTAKDYADGLAVNYDENGAAAAVQGDTTETVKSVNDKVEALTMATEAEVKALFTAE